MKGLADLLGKRGKTRATARQSRKEGEQERASRKSVGDWRAMSLRVCE